MAASTVLISDRFKQVTMEEKTFFNDRSSNTHRTPTPTRHPEDTHRRARSPDHREPHPDGGTTPTSPTANNCPLLSASTAAGTAGR